MLERSLRLPQRPRTSFFLWGPRQTGKSTLLRASYPRARVIDLLARPERRASLERRPPSPRSLVSFVEPAWRSTDAVICAG
jgi:hypothetical protein